MTGDDDLKAFLPEAPPPAPKRREAAIADALARLDGSPAPKVAPRPATVSWWNDLRRPQAGLLATAALVAAISLPFAWTSLGPNAPAADEQVGGETGETVQTVADKKVEVPAPVAIAAPPISENSRAAPQLAAALPAVAAPAAKPVELAEAAPAAPAPKAEEREAIIVSAQRTARAVQDSPSAVSVISSGDAAEDSVVVTGTRIAGRGAPRRGDWNACTVTDPSRALSRCKKLANRGAKEVRTQADAHLAAGLERAWEGDLDGAITAFDEAIAAAPDLSVAYLNRGLTYDRQGESARAIADLDRAVRHAPQSARAYYNRSLLLRKQGDTKRADADEQRAINLDARYQAIRQSRERD
ncbi:MAG: tetratricopeptide repeat protein [Sphingomonadales bacterium]|nr:MAG: tetratricopeptide repeat protein [Sphingomonadales bacterium]